MAPEYPAQRARSENFLSDTNLYWRVSGWIFAAIALVGIVAQFVSDGVVIPGILVLTWSHNVLHIALAMLSLAIGYGRPSMDVQKGMAVFIGIVYLGLGLVGLLSDSMFGLGNVLGMHLDIGEDLFHLLLGAWAVYAGATGPA